MSLDPWMVWGLVGTISGSVLGLAGAGGGVIAIPILIYLGGYSVKVASGYGLLVLSVGALLTWFPQRRNTHYVVAGTLLVFSFFGAHVSASWKVLSPEWVVIVFLNSVSLFSLYSLWLMKQPIPVSPEKHTVVYSIFRSSPGGFLAGILSTMTGLGGGVLMVPWLTSVNRLHLNQAVACSLLTISLSAPYSVYVQGYFNVPWSSLLALIMGILLAAVSLRRLSLFLSASTLDLTRRITLTNVVIISMISTLIKLL